MKRRPFVTTLTILLIVTLITPSVFLIAPPRAQAIPVTEVGANLLTNIKTTVESTISAIRNTITSVATVTSAAANTAMLINMNVLQPLAFVLSGNLLKMLTAGVIAFVIGKANGTGVPQFVVDVQRSLQTIGDKRAIAYFNQFGRNSNSPFAAAIASSLRNNYLQKTSLAGFWAANMNTLARFSPNVNAYLAGDWSQGGVAAWLALTTQVQNNPYTFYQNSQDQLGVLIGPGVGGATGARIAELGWGNGFTSWCGTAGTAYTPGQNGSGVNPGDPCTDADGNPSTIKTPGSLIAESLNKALGSQQDKWVAMGNVGPQINQILGNIATVMQTVNFATQILGGSGSGGLFGVDSTSGGNSTSPLSQFQNSAGYLGVTQSNVYQTASTLPASGSDMSNRVLQYESAWSTIGAAAQTASTSVASLANICTAAAKSAEFDPLLATFVAAANAQSDAAWAALTTEIDPVLAKAAAVPSITAAARALVQKVQDELNAGNTDAATSNYTNDVQTLQTMTPTLTDVANAQQDAQAFGTAEANPPGSLTVASTSSSVVDQMNLIGTNAEALKSSVCTPPSVTTDMGGAQ